MSGSADLLRRAAVALREAAEAATQGPWGAGNDDQVVAGLDQKSPGVMSYRYHVADCASFSRDDEDEDGCYNPAEPDDDAAFIALVHPPVALALADAMDDRAEECNEADECHCWQDGSAGASLARVARAVLREEAS